MYLNEVVCEDMTWMELAEDCAVAGCCRSSGKPAGSAPAGRSLFVLLRRVKSFTFVVSIDKEAVFIQGVPGGMCKTSGGCSLC